MVTTLSSSAVALLLGALSAIVVLAYAGGSLAARLGQPRVVGEIVVGLLIGALPLAWFAPASAVPLPVVLQGLATVGLVLFMFLVGMELEAPRARGAWRGPLAAAGGSVLVPFGLGTALATTLAAPAGRSVSFTLFFGVSLAVTAFPVLARIVRERAARGDGHDHALGHVAMATAAVADVLAWLLLIGVLGAESLQQGALARLLLLVPYAAALAGMRAAVLRGGVRLAGPAGLALLIAGLAASAAFTEWLGLHAIIGAFAFGAALPTRQLKALHTKLEPTIGPLVSSLLLPPFFVLAGTHADLSAAAALGVPTTLAILAVAVVGKAGGTVLGALLGGFDGRTSVELAVLMNTRGLTELIVLDIGRQSGLLDPGLYSVLVLMALVTTAATAPALAAVDRWKRARASRRPPVPDLSPTVNAVARPRGGRAVPSNNS